jgi:hypothetical protein
MNTGDFILRWIVAILALILLMAAFFHGLALGTPQYPYSPLIYIEVALAFVLIFLIPAYIVSALVTAYKRNWVSLRGLLANLFLGILFVYGALMSDAPTLINMT